MSRWATLRFRIGGTAFFQVSGLAASRLTSLVLEEATLAGTERVLELYCGAGTFTVPLAKRAREVVGIETNPAAAADGAINLRENGCATGRIVQAQVEQALPALAGEGRWNLVVLDPPRQGCSRAVVDRLAAMRVAAGDLCFVRSEHARPRPWRARPRGVSVYETSPD